MSCRGRGKRTSFDSLASWMGLWQCGQRIFVLAGVESVPLGVSRLALPTGVAGCELVAYGSNGKSMANRASGADAVANGSSGGGACPSEGWDDIGSRPQVKGGVKLDLMVI